MPRRRTRLSGSRRTALGILLLVLAAVGIRSFVAAPRLVPSESMLPALWPGDLMLVAKWSYGWSRESLPMAPPLFRGRIWQRLPGRGDIVVFRPPGSSRDEVKRVIGLPGDTVELRKGIVRINGRPLHRWRIGDIVVPVTPNNRCHGTPERDEGRSACRYRRDAEMLPGGRFYPVLEIGDLPSDTMPPLRVPRGRLFLLGDNRDRSGDSREIGPVELERLIGRPLFVFWSSDGSMQWTNPASWWRALRPERLGSVG